jgi:hypothetical protein
MTMDAVITAHLELTRLGPCEWEIVDLRHPADDAWRSFGLVRDDEETVVVTWRPGVPLPTRYATAESALDDAMRWAEHHTGGTRPIPIPHFAPPVAR